MKPKNTTETGSGADVGSNRLLESHDKMTQEQAEQKAQEWENLLEDSESEYEAGCTGAAEKLSNEAREIEKQVEESGYQCVQLLRQIKARRRAL